MPTIARPLEVQSRNDFYAPYSYSASCAIVKGNFQSGINQNSRSALIAKSPFLHQKKTQSGMGIEDNTLENGQTDPSTHHLLPPDQNQCRRSGYNEWKCQALALPGNRYCDKHRLEQDLYNAKRRIARPKKGNHFHTEPVLPSGERQCRRNGKGWRCSLLAPPLKIYCQKHELEQNAYNVKKKERRKRKDRGLIESDEMKSSTADCSTVSKRTKENFEEIRVESLKRDSRDDVASEESLFPVNEGVVDEHTDKTMSIAQIDSVQLLRPILEEHQMPSMIEDNDDNQVLPVDPIIRGESTVDNIEQPQSSNEVDDSLNFEYIDNEAVLPLVDMAHSYPLQHEEAPILLESVSCNLPDGRSKTAVKEFVGQKLQFDMMLARFNKRLEAYELEKNAHSEMSKEYRELKDQGLTEFEEMVSSSGHYLTVVKRTKNNEEGRRIEHGRVGSPKRDSGNDVALEKSLFLANEGVVDEHADKNLSNAQIESAQLLNPILEERKTLPSIHEKANPSIMEDNDDNQFKLLKKMKFLMEKTKFLMEKMTGKIDRRCRSRHRRLTGEYRVERGLQG